MFANPSPFALTLPKGMVMVMIEDVDSVVTLPLWECKAEVAAVEPVHTTDRKTDPLEYLVVESHFKSVEM